MSPDLVDYEEQTLRYGDLVLIEELPTVPADSHATGRFLFYLEDGAAALVFPGGTATYERDTQGFSLGVVVPIEEVILLAPDGSAASNSP